MWWVLIWNYSKLQIIDFQQVTKTQPTIHICNYLIFSKLGSFWKGWKGCEATPALRLGCDSEIFLLIFFRVVCQGGCFGLWYVW